MQKIDRYDPAEDELGCMGKDPHGDYVEFSDHESIVSELEQRIDTLQKIVNEVFRSVQAEAK